MDNNERNIKTRLADNTDEYWDLTKELLKAKTSDEFWIVQQKLDKNISERTRLLAQIRMESIL